MKFTKSESTLANRITVLAGFTFLIILLYIGAWFMGIAPASKGEKEFIKMLEQSSFNNTPEVQAVVMVVNNSAYISRKHFFAAEEAFNKVTSTTITSKK